MIYKITLSISGVEFEAKSVKVSESNDFLIIDQFNANDIGENSMERYGYGSISIWHPKKFSLQENIQEYEDWHINFILENAENYISLGAEEFELYYEVYSDGEQCNFSILDPKSVKKLSEFNLNLPISTYVLSKDELENWRTDIEKIWATVLL